nr:MAG TPA: hypothetical protein [Caudoviricetes sp.]
MTSYCSIDKGLKTFLINTLSVCVVSLTCSTTVSPNTKFKLKTCMHRINIITGTNFFLIIITISIVNCRIK